MSITYLVPWEKVVDEAFLPEFTSISMSLYRARFTENPAQAEKEVLDKLKDEVREKYSRARYMMRKSGYELREEIGTGRWRGWFTPYLDDKARLQFLTTAPPERHLVSLADFMSYKNLYNLPEENAIDYAEKVRKLAEHARYMANKCGVGDPGYTTRYDPEKRGPLSKALDELKNEERPVL